MKMQCGARVEVIPKDPKKDEKVEKALALDSRPETRGSRLAAGACNAPRGCFRVLWSSFRASLLLDFDLIFT